jgi:hypothetical protein
MAEYESMSDSTKLLIDLSVFLVTAYVYLIPRISWIYREKRHAYRDKATSKPFSASSRAEVVLHEYYASDDQMSLQTRDSYN